MTSANSSSFADARDQSSPGLSQEERAALGALDAGDLHGLRGFIAADRAAALQRRITEMLRTGRVVAPGQF